MLINSQPVYHNSSVLRQRSVNYYCLCLLTDWLKRIFFNKMWSKIASLVFKWAIRGIYISNLTVNKDTIENATVWIQTRILWCGNHLLCQPCHNHWPLASLEQLLSQRRFMNSLLINRNPYINFFNKMAIPGLFFFILIFYKKI